MSHAPACPTGPTGLLVVNLGTPDAPEPGAVRRYLREFLSDPRVIDIPAAARWLLLEAVILPTRPRQSAEAYAKVWTDEGSPLLANSRAFAAQLADELGATWKVALGMRYGRPSLAAALDELLAVTDRLVVFPQYPHVASSSTGSTLEEVFRLLSGRQSVPSVSVVPPFFDDPGFLEAWSATARPILEDFRPDHVLFSFHGLPERHVLRSAAEPPAAPTARCLTDGCCDALRADNRGCYRAQSFETARRLAERLSLDGQVPWTVSFQSRLGRTPWIRPYTDLEVERLAGDGVRRVAVLCPGFVADCLETLEEIGLRARESFRAAGGEDLRLVPSLNAHPAWVSAAADLARRAAWD